MNEANTTRVPIGPGTRVKLLFTLRMANGDEVDSTGIRPAVFTVGDGNLLPGFERAMFGMRAGDEGTLSISAEHGFGEHIAANVQRMLRSEFAPDMMLEEGLIVSFADKQKAELPGVISKVEGNMIEVDFNHPLAGRELRFEVSILEVEQVSNEIARTGP